MAHIRRWGRSLKTRKLGMERVLRKGRAIYRAVKRDIPKFKKLGFKGKFKKLNILIRRYAITRYKFARFLSRMGPSIFSGAYNLAKRKKIYTVFGITKRIRDVKRSTLKGSIFKGSATKLLHYRFMETKLGRGISLLKNKFLRSYTIDDDLLGYGPIFKITLITDKIFFFNLKRILKCLFFKKNLTLKLRNIENLVPHKLFKWEDALRTAFLVQVKKKHFIRTIFKDFSYLNKVAFLEGDAQLFAKIIINMFEMTKFHRRLINLLKSVFKTLNFFYTHLDFKVRMRGKMQFRRRTRTVFIFQKVVIPLNVLYISTEYGKGYANTPFGVIGIKTWLYYKRVILETPVVLRKNFYLNNSNLFDPTEKLWINRAALYGENFIKFYRSKKSSLFSKLYLGVLKSTASSIRRKLLTKRT